MAASSSPDGAPQVDTAPTEPDDELDSFAAALGFKTGCVSQVGEWFTDRWWEIRVGWEVKPDGIYSWYVFDRGGTYEDSEFRLVRKANDGRICASVVVAHADQLVECRQSRLPDNLRAWSWGVSLDEYKRLMGGAA